MHAHFCSKNSNGIKSECFFKEKKSMYVPTSVAFQFVESTRRVRASHRFRRRLARVLNAFRHKHQTSRGFSFSFTPLYTNLLFSQTQFRSTRLCTSPVLVDICEGS